MSDSSRPVNDINVAASLFGGSGHYQLTSMMAHTMMATFAGMFGVPSRQVNEFLSGFSNITSSSGMAHAMWQWGTLAPADKMDEHNHHLFTHDSKKPLGINKITSTGIVKHFRTGSSDAWPAVVLTANHAMSEDTEDLSGIMGSIERFISASLNRIIPFESDPHRFNPAHKGLMTAALFTYKNAWMNGGAALHRYNYLCTHPSLKDRVAIPTTAPVPGMDAEEIRAQGMSPASIRLAKTMIKMLLDRPESANHPSPHHEGDSFVDDEETFEDLYRNGTPLPKPLVLREDAIEVASHIMLIGYSKAATTVTDAMRYLAYELSSRDQNGDPIFSIRQGKTCKPLFRTGDVSDIISHIGLIPIGGPEVPLTQEEYDLGIRRRRIHNINDVKSMHFIDQELMRNTYVHEDDRPFLVDGYSEEMGHAPAKMSELLQNELVQEHVAAYLQPRFHSIGRGLTKF